MSGGGRQIGGVAFGGTAGHPVSQLRDFFLGKRLLVAKLTKAFDCSPGRHTAVSDFFRNGDSPGAGLFIGQE